MTTVVKLVEATKAPLGFFTFALLIVETFLGTVLLASDLPGDSKVNLVYVGVGIFVLVVLVVTALVWVKPESLIFGQYAHLARQQLKAAVSLGAASTKNTTLTDDNDDGINRIVDAVWVTASAAAERNVKRTNHVLWVDDRPENNRYERRAFEAVGLRFTLAQSTDEALEKLGQSTYAAIISDMGRREGPREGYVLLDRLREQVNSTPLFFYASSNAPQHKQETREHGGQGCTNNPQELFAMVTRAVIEN